MSTGKESLTSLERTLQCKVRYLKWLVAEICQHLCVIEYNGQNLILGTKNSFACLQPVPLHRTLIQKGAILMQSLS